MAPLHANHAEVPSNSGCVSIKSESKAPRAVGDIKQNAFLASKGKVSSEADHFFSKLSVSVNVFQLGL